MRSITEESRMVMNTRRNFVNYARVTLHDGTVLYLTPSDFRIAGNSFTDDWCDGEALQLGSVIGKTATLLLDNTDGREEVVGSTTVVYPHGKFSEYDFYMSYFELYVHLPNSTHYQGELIDEVITIGTFTVTTPEARGATIEITGVDNMYMFDKSFDECNLNFDLNPTLITILNKCCSDCGVAIGYTTFANKNLTVSKKPEGVTYRQVVSYIAQMAGCNAKISVSGALTLQWYDMSHFNDWLDGGTFSTTTTPYSDGDTADGGSFNPWNTGYVADGGDFISPLPYHNLVATNGTSISTDDIEFTGAMVSYEVEVDGNSETQVVHYPDVSGWDTYAMQVSENPFITADNASTIAVTIWNAISDLKFRVFSCSSLQDPTIEAGDSALVYDVKGNVYKTIITNVNFKTGGMTNVSCKAESPVKQNQRYVNPAARAVAKAKENMNAYNVMVAHFNEIANAALGYYKTETTESGATVTYYHNAPTLAASTNIVKINANGIFISDDGGQSYNSGVDVTTATMLMNLIYVNGLNAKWITAGQIDTARLNVSGIVKVINGNDNGTTIDGGKITTNTITATQIKDGTVGTTEIAGGAITVAKIADGAVSETKIAGGAITTGKIATGAVTAGKITVDNLASINANLGTITAGSIDASKVSVTKLSASNITTGNLNANLITTGALNADLITVGSMSAARITSGTMSADRIYGGSIASSNFNRGSGHYSTAGTKLFLSTGEMRSPHFAINESGDVYINGYVDVSEGGSIGNWTVHKPDDETSNVGRGALNWNDSYFLAPIGAHNTFALPVTGRQSFVRVRFGDKFAIDSGGNVYIDGTITASAGYIGTKSTGWTIDAAGLKHTSTVGSQSTTSWVKPDEISTGAHGATLVKMKGTTTANDNSGYLSVEVNSSSDYVRVYYNEIRKKTSSGTYAVEWTGSDKRLKKNIKDLTLEEAQELLSKVRPRSFEFKSEAGKRYGFIAQELRKELDDDCGVEYGNSIDDYRAIHYGDFVAPLIKVVQHQQEEINTLKEEVELLKQLVNTK